MKNSNCKLQSSDLTGSFFLLPWQLGRTASNVRSSYRPKRRETCVIITTQITVSLAFFPRSNYRLSAHTFSVIKYKLSRFRSNYLGRRKSLRGNPKVLGACRDLCSAVREDVAQRAERKLSQDPILPVYTLITYISVRVRVKCQCSQGWACTHSARQSKQTVSFQKYHVYGAL